MRGGRSLWDFTVSVVYFMSISSTSDLGLGIYHKTPSIK